MASKSTRIRKPHTAVLPYKLLTILMYGRFRWLHRDGAGWVRCTTRQMCVYLNTEPDHVKGCLKSLENWGVIRKLNHYGTYWEVQLEIPVGMAIYQPSITLTPSTSQPELFELLSHTAEELEAMRAADPDHILNQTHIDGEGDEWMS